MGLCSLGGRLPRLLTEFGRGLLVEHGGAGSKEADILLLTSVCTLCKTSRNILTKLTTSVPDMRLCSLGEFGRGEGLEHLVEALACLVVLGGCFLYKK